MGQIREPMGGSAVCLICATAEGVAKSTPGGVFDDEVMHK